MEMPLAGWGLVYFGGLATLSEIARRQGKFWPFHDAVHARDRLPDRDALALGVEGTPTVFVSGRRALNPSKKTMNMLMWHQIGLELEQA